MFGDALITDESFWMLEAFIKEHGKQQPLAVTDQDTALRKATIKMFVESHHRLCMWHMTQKLSGEYKVILRLDSQFRKDFPKLIWNVYIDLEKGPTKAHRLKVALVGGYDKGVMFGDALITDESFWMLEAFIKEHGKQQPLAVTDQDTALRKATIKMFVESHHRLCMWHMTQKLSGE
nr:protein FAR1-related sequence 5-like [Tanacetum cinerariifolium]